MDLFSIIVTILGLCLFETITSIDNAIINAEVLSTMKAQARRWFLVWGLLIAVFAVRGLLPWLIVWVSHPTLGMQGAFTAIFSNDPSVREIVEGSSSVLLIAGGTFLIFLFFHWLFLEEKSFGLRGERYLSSKGVWFYAVVSVILSYLVWIEITDNKPFVAFGAVIGSTAFFIVHGFRQNAEAAERSMIRSNMSDLSKIVYLEVIDTTFSIDGVIGAFAFTTAVPLILIGNGIGAFVVRELTIRNIENIKRYKFLKNGAMYSIFTLGIIMILESLEFTLPLWLSPLMTFAIVGLFFYKSIKSLDKR